MESSMPTSGADLQSKYPIPRLERKKRVGLDFLKCQFCRISKQKCVPTQVQWPQGKCQRCTEHNLACSELQRAKRIKHHPVTRAARSAKIENPEPSLDLSFDPTTLFDPSSIFYSNEVPQLAVVPAPTWFTTFDPLPQEGHNIKRIDLLVSVLDIITITTEQLVSLAEDMGRPFKKVADWKLYEAHLDRACELYHDFTAVLQKKLADVPTKWLLTDWRLEALHEHRISKMCSAENVEKARRRIKELLEAGRCGAAYLLQLGQLRRFPKQMGEQDYTSFREGATQFLGLLKDPLFSQELSPYAPELFRAASIFLPWPPHESSTNRTEFVPEVFLQDMALGIRTSANAKRDCLGRTASHILADQGSSDMHVTDAPFKDALGRTPLHIACGNGDADMVDKLLAAGAYVGTVTILNQTPLHIAAALGHTEICRRILKGCRGSSLTHWIERYEDYASYTPLCCAASTGHRETVEFLSKELHRTRNVVHSRLEFGKALICAVRSSQANVVQAFLDLDLGYCADIVDRESRNSFWYSVQGSHYAIMKALAPLVKPDCKDSEGRTPLAEAARKGDVEAVKFLLSLYQDPYESLISAMGNWKVNPNSKDNEGNSPLLLAARGGKTECVWLLLEHPGAFSFADVSEAEGIARASQEPMQLVPYQRFWVKNGLVA